MFTKENLERLSLLYGNTTWEVEKAITVTIQLHQNDINGRVYKDIYDNY